MVAGLGCAPTYSTCLRGWHANTLEMLGRWDEATAIGATTLATVWSPVNRLTSLVALGRILARRADPSAGRYLDEAIENARTLDEREWIVYAGSARVEARWLTGDLDAARDELAAIYDAALVQDAWVRGSLGVWLRCVESELAPPTDRITTPYAVQMQGEHAATALAWDELGMPYDAALALHDAGTEEGFREALIRFEALGAVAAVQATRREMRRIGLRSIPSGERAATREHPFGLTRRQAGVLERICAGRTNAEISAELFVSPRTVDHYVSAVLAKLGVASRAQAASESKRRGLVSAQG